MKKKKSAKKRKSAPAKKVSMDSAGIMPLSRARFRAYCETCEKWLSRNWRLTLADAEADAQPHANNGDITDIKVKV